MVLLWILDGIPWDCLKGKHCPMCVCAGCRSGEDNITLYRFPEWQEDLPSEHMTVVSRRGAVDHNPVTIIQLLDLKISPELLYKNKNSI